MRANTRVNKSLVQALGSCPSSDGALPAVLPSSIPSLGENRRLRKCIRRQPKLGCGTPRAMVATTALVLSQNGLRSTLRASDFQKFPGGACPQTPLVLHAYAQITQTCKPPSKSPGYWPGLYSSLASQTQTTPARIAGIGWVWLARLDYIGKHLAGMQTRTQYEKSACTQLTRVVKLDLTD